MTGTPAPSPLSGTDIVDEYFIETRNRIVEVAAFLDRLDRVAPTIATTDFRVRALAEAIDLLGSHSTSRVRDIQMLLSDPRTEPLPALDRKGAVGAYDHGKAGR